jgi:2-alkenal reductase
LNVKETDFMFEPQPQKKNRALWVAGGLFAVLLFGCILLTVVGVFLIGSSSLRQSAANVRPAPARQPIVQQVAAPTPRAPVVVATPEGGFDYESTVLMNIYTQVNPSVVNVTHLELGRSLSSDLPNGVHGDDLIPVGTGSGFIWDAQGHIVTNYHVVEGADQLQVTFSDGTMSVAEVIGVDITSDLAVLKIDPDGYKLLPVRRGKMDAIRVGMRVAAIGNPFGLRGTLTSGIVSAVGRSIPARANFSIPLSIQTDAAINPGNSGGPLLDEQGEVIGVNAQINSETGSNSGVGFAIPIVIVERVAAGLIADGKYQHSYLGVSGETVSPICADDLGLPKTVRGAYLARILANTPAEKAALHAGEEPSNTKYLRICPETRGGDVIMAINDQPVTSFDDVLAYLESHTSPGDKVTLRIWRNNQEYLVDVTLAARPESS